ncbi:MAG: CHASE2 domain-containing protein [Oleispira sp.]|nr:CHASE2 domain-containing protein [Oleispira sp.]MBL4882416.1 CHASE2 domain-containing protein [Oleispira sp.]
MANVSELLSTARNPKRARVFFDWQLIIFGLVILLFVNLNQLENWTQTANFSLYDTQLKNLSIPADKKILIIEIDEQSLSLIGEWPWPRSYHGQLIELLTQAEVGVIAYNVVFSHSNSEDRNDIALSQAIEKNGRTILPLYFDRLTKTGEVSEVLPANSFRNYASLGHVNSYLDSDGTLRSIRLIDRFSDRHWLHFSLATLLFNQPSSTDVEGTEKDVFIPFVTQGDFDRVSFVDVLTGIVPIEVLAQRTIFVGMTATSMGDPLLTPVDDNGRQSPAVDINANVYQALKNDSLILPLPVIACAVINSFVILLALYLIPRLSGMQQIVMTAVCFITVWFITYGLLMLGYWYASSGLMMALLVIPFIWNLLRLSRLFNYLRMQVKRLKQQQVSEVFRLPEFIQLNSEADLESILLLLQVESYQLKSTVEIDQGPMLSILKSLVIRIGEQDKLLVMHFDEFTDLEKRKLKLLSQLLGSKNSIVADKGQVRSDMFSQQLLLVNSYQQQVAMSHSMFEASIGGIAAGILVTDLAGKVLFSNQVVKEITNNKIANLNDLFTSISLLENDWVTVLREAILLQQPMMVEAKSVEVDLSVSIRCIESQENLAPILVFNLTDVSAIKQAYRSRNEMIDFLSHDLRSPMASLQALVQQVRNSPESSSAANIEIINKVDQYSQRGLDFAEQFLNLAKVESEEVIQLYEVDLYSISQNALDSLYLQAQEKSIKLSLSVVDDCWVMANGDLLERIILNLVSNAIKYSPLGSEVLVSIDNQESLSSTQLLEIRITDQGPGIPTELLDGLFKPYQRGSDSNTQQAQGIGLGLRFVDVALKRLGSQIKFDSSASGASFYFTCESIEV